MALKSARLANYIVSLRKELLRLCHAMGHSHPSMNPSGGVGVRREPMQPALHDDLMVRVMAPSNLRRAWRRVKANRGAPGVDGMTIDDFPAFARQHWSDIRRRINCLRQHFL